MNPLRPPRRPSVNLLGHDYRAAVREFDGKQAREHAEAEAFTEAIRAWRGSEGATD